VAAVGPSAVKSGASVSASAYGVQPSDRAAADDARVLPGECGKLRRACGVGDHVAHPTTFETVLDVTVGKERGRRAQHRAQLHRRQGDLPQRHDVGEHHQHAIAPPHPQPPQEVGDPVGAHAHLLERHLPLGAVLVDDPERRAIVAARHVVEVVECPVEFVEGRPPKAVVCLLVVGAMREEEVARLDEAARCTHGCGSLVRGTGRWRPAGRDNDAPRAVPVARATVRPIRPR
jgi:hypothetical protein